MTGTICFDKNMLLRCKKDFENSCLETPEEELNMVYPLATLGIILVIAIIVSLF